jgi:hypothetical protein
MNSRRPALILILLALAAFTLWAHNTLVQFTPQQGTKPAAVSFASTSIQPQVSQAGFFGPPPQLESDDIDSKLPAASSALPLLSVIGFGVLLGGIASAMKTR